MDNPLLESIVNKTPLSYIIDIIIKEEKQIYDFILKSNHKSSIKIKTRKNKRINKIYKKHHNTYNYRKNNI